MLSHGRLFRGVGGRATPVQFLQVHPLRHSRGPGTPERPGPPSKGVSHTSPTFPQRQGHTRDVKCSETNGPARPGSPWQTQRCPAAGTPAGFRTSCSLTSATEEQGHPSRLGTQALPPTMHRAWATCINTDIIIIPLATCRAYLGCLLAVTWRLANSHQGDRPVAYGRPSLSPGPCLNSPLPQRAGHSHAASADAGGRT